jgi:hypothetical protein
MNVLLRMGSGIVILALAAYSVAIITEQRKRHVINAVLTFMTVGIVLDITATAFMILGSTNPPWTLHGILGYSSLAAMLLDAILLWRHRLVHGAATEVSKSLHLYSRVAYVWWLLAFATGAAISISKYA